MGTKSFSKPVGHRDEDDFVILNEGLCQVIRYFVEAFGGILHFEEGLREESVFVVVHDADHRLGFGGHDLDCGGEFERFEVLI